MRMGEPIVAKEFQKLTIKDAFMFAAVMSDAGQCRRLLEMTLDIRVLEVTVVAEKTMVYHPEYHGVRLDVLAEEHGTKRRFNVEMQVKAPAELPRRTRYYHSQMDMDLLAAGMDYADLPNTYVIFICDFKPFNRKPSRYRYTFRSRCDEDGQVLEDGRLTVFLSTRGENEYEVPKELVRFLRYVGNPAVLSEDTAQDPYVRSLEKHVAAIKSSRRWEAKYVLLEEMMQEERILVRQETVIELLERFGPVPEEVIEKITEEKRSAVLKQWHLAAAEASSVEDFMERAGL